ncbi:MAG: ATP-dependent DNA helicase RecG [Akkermansia sp.]
MGEHGAWGLTTPLAQVPFLRGRELAILEMAHLVTVHDLLMRAPRRYEDRRQFDGFDALSESRPVCLNVRVVDMGWRGARGRNGYFEAIVEERSGLALARVSCRWFHFPAIARMLCVGQELCMYGKPKVYGKTLCMVHPEFEVVQETDSIHMGRIVPVYGNMSGLQSKRYRELVWVSLQGLSDTQEPTLYEFAPHYPRQTALRQLHFPEELSQYVKARRRFALEECFVQQLNVAWRRRHDRGQRGLVTVGTTHLVKDLSKMLPFELTESQKQCVREIYQDMHAPHPMNRLVQGDVGSGKTLVAMCAMLMAVEKGYQAVLMAPTQILAEQHYKSFRTLLDPMDVPVSLRTGDRREDSCLSFTPTNQAGIIIGTHALLYEKNAPDHPGLVVIDEQHKFGVEQREKLIASGVRPDVLVMTATPIPRTLTLTIYGDLDVSVIDKLPEGRGKITTAIRSSKEMKKVVAFVKGQIEEGRQIYIVSPLIEEGSDIASPDSNSDNTPPLSKKSKKGKISTVLQDLEIWQKRLPGIDIGLLHGKMSTEEKESVMRDFHLNKTSVLVTTTVIEVGVDVPNATVMMINNAERFGLSQLHQLRGRIGRGAHHSYCILLSDITKDDEQWEKLQIINQTLDGFLLAEEDLRLRGPGNVLGTEQSGVGKIRFDEWLTDLRLIHRGRELAEQLMREDPHLTLEKNRPLRALIDHQSPKAATP